jgi:hypothetical protein
VRQQLSHLNKDKLMEKNPLIPKFWFLTSAMHTASSSARDCNVPQPFLIDFLSKAGD